MGSARALGRGVGRGCSGGTSSDGGNGGSLGRLGSGSEISTGRRSVGRAGRAGPALGTDGVVKDLVGRAAGLGAGSALGSRAGVSRVHISRRSGRSHVSLGDAANGVVCEGGVASQACRAAGTRGTGADGSSLVNVAGLVRKAAFAIQSAALAGNELTSLLLAHMLVPLLDGNIRQDTYVRRRFVSTCCSLNLQTLNINTIKLQKKEKQKKIRPDRQASILNHLLANNIFFI